MVLGNVAILLGSGILGSVLIGNDGKLPSAGGLLSGAAKFLKKHEKGGKDSFSSSSSATDSHTAYLMSQVDHLREEIRFLTTRQVTIVTRAATSGPGSFTITAVVAAGVIGYAYIKWKGWKLSDMMFVTKRGLSDACNVVGSQLDQVSDSVNVTKRHLAGRIDRVDISLDENQTIIEGTRDEVAGIHRGLSAFQEDLQSVNLVVQNLESKLGSLEYTQDRTVNGIRELVEFSQQIEHEQNAKIHEVAPSIPPAIGSSEQIVRRALPPVPKPLQTVSPVAESLHRVEATQRKQDFPSRTSCTREEYPVPSNEASLSNGVSSSTESSSSRFGRKLLSGLGFLLSSASL